MWERIIEVPFDVTIPPSERNPRLRSELFEEGPGILELDDPGEQPGISPKVS